MTGEMDSENVNEVSVFVLANGFVVFDELAVLKSYARKLVTA